MTGFGLPALVAEDVAAMFAGFRDGSDDILGVLDGAPVLLVDLDGGSEVTVGPVPTLFPSIVVGVGRHLRSPGDLSALDVLVTIDDAPSSVVVDDLDESVMLLTQAILSAPAASVTLAQILRAGESTEPAQGLLYESLAYSTLQSSAVFRGWLSRRVSPSATPDESGEALVAFERIDDEMHLTLNRPEVRNALGSTLRDALCEALSLAAADSSVTRVHLHGAGPDFCSGGDLAEFGTATDGASAHLIRVTRSPAYRLLALSARVSAHLHGACIGAGIEIPAFAGHVVAAPGTWFRLPEIAMGLIPGAGGTVSIPRRIGRHRTAWMALTGERLEVDRALRWGLIDEIASATSISW